jgi:hypothetical protein
VLFLGGVIGTIEIGTIGTIEIGTIGTIEIFYDTLPCL